MTMKKFKFSAGPWNIMEGADPFGPAVRKPLSLAKKLEIFKKIGIDAVQFHDDDVVPGINSKSSGQIKAEAAHVKKLLDDHGLKAEFVAPRLWEDGHVIDGALTSNDPKNREYSINRAKTAVDIARMLDCNMIGFWFAREGTVCYESKDPVIAWNYLVEGLNQVLEHDKQITMFIEPKPNEPVDRSICPTMGHAMALSMQTIDPSRVGGLVESAHAILAGLDPANEMACALSFGKLLGVHLNDQNGMKFDQDKSFGAENIRQAFNQIRLLVQYNYGDKGQYIGLDVKAMRTQKDELAWKHIENSMKIVDLLTEKAYRYNAGIQKQFVEERDYESLEFYVLEHLLKG
jgi:xylose isomerase